MGRGQFDHSGPRGPYARPWQGTKLSPLAEARILRKLTQAQAAALLGMDRSQFAGYESGTRSWPGYRWKGREVRAKLEKFIAEAAEPLMPGIETSTKGDE